MESGCSGIVAAAKQMPRIAEFPSAVLQFTCSRVSDNPSSGLPLFLFSDPIVFAALIAETTLQ